MKAYIHFPYDLMKLHTLKKLLSFSINLFTSQLYPPKKLTSWVRFPSDVKHSSARSSFGDGRQSHQESALGSRTSANPQVSSDRFRALLPYATATSTSAFTNPAMFRTLQQTVSDSEMTQRSRKGPRVL